MACTVDSTHHKKQCIERFLTIFERMRTQQQQQLWQEQEPKSELTQGQQARASSGAAPPVVSFAAGETTTLGYTRRRWDFNTPSRTSPTENMEGPTVVHQPQPATPPTQGVVLHRDSLPKKRGISPARNPDAAEAVPDSKKDRARRRSAGVCCEHHWILFPDRRALRGTRH